MRFWATAIKWKLDSENNLERIMGARLYNVERGSDTWASSADLIRILRTPRMCIENLWLNRSGQLGLIGYRESRTVKEVRRGHEQINLYMIVLGYNGKQYDLLIGTPTKTDRTILDIEQLDRLYDLQHNKRIFLNAMISGRAETGYVLEPLDMDKNFVETDFLSYMADRQKSGSNLSEQDSGVSVNITKENGLITARLNCSDGIGRYSIQEGVECVAKVFGGINELVFPSTMRELGKGACLELDDLRKVQFNRGSVIEIADKAFMNSGLKEVTCCGEIARVGKYAFYGTYIRNLDMSKLYDVGSNCFAYSRIEIADLKSLITTGTESFANCDKLKAVRIGKRAALIGTRAFFKCRKLKLLIVESVGVQLGDEAFAGCNKKMKAVVATADQAKELKKQGIKNVVVNNNLSEADIERLLQFERS